MKKGKILMPYLLMCSGICYLDGEEFELLKMCANFPCSQADNSFIQLVALQRKIASRNIKQGGILIKFQNQSNRRVSQIGESVIDFFSRVTVTLILINKYSLEK